jgi:hypothetical protein
MQYLHTRPVTRDALHPNQKQPGAGALCRQLSELQISQIDAPGFVGIVRPTTSGRIAAAASAKQQGGA